MGGTNTKTKGEIIQLGDIGWYRPYCNHCPYFINDVIMKKLHCIRPTNEECLAESLLVAGTIMAEAHNTMVAKMKVDKDRKPLDDVVKKLSQKRQKKLLKLNKRRW